MSELADRIEEARSSVISTGAKILVFDIERMKGRFTGEFWDLNDYKGRRIHPHDVLEWPRTICVAWNWYGDNKVEFASEWGDGTEGMLERVWKAVDDADIVVGHNIAGFDLKKLNTEWRDHGFMAPSTYKIVDTLREARKQFGDESKTLDALCERLGVFGKTDKYDVEIARLALDGDKAAQKKLQEYNEGDIFATLNLYDRLRGWMPSHPHIGPWDGETMKCNQCGGTDLERSGIYQADMFTYIEYRCQTCGGNVKGSTGTRIANSKGVK